MEYWLVSLTEDNFFIAMQAGVLGGKKIKQKTMENMKPGDRLVFYVSRKRGNSHSSPVQQFRGIGTVSGETFNSDKKLWKGEGKEIYPVRTPFRSDTRAAASVRSLLERLDFVRNTPRWGVMFFNTPRRISFRDFEIICKALAKP